MRATHEGGPLVFSAVLRTANSNAPRKLVGPQDR